MGVEGSLRAEIDQRRASGEHFKLRIAKTAAAAENLGKATFGVFRVLRGVQGAQIEVGWGRLE